MNVEINAGSGVRKVQEEKGKFVLKQENLYTVLMNGFGRSPLEGIKVFAPDATGDHILQLIMPGGTIIEIRADRGGLYLTFEKYSDGRFREYLSENYVWYKKQPAVYRNKPNPEYAKIPII